MTAAWKHAADGGNGDAHNSSHAAQFARVLAALRDGRRRR